MRYELSDYGAHAGAAVAATMIAKNLDMAATLPTLGPNAHRASGRYHGRHAAAAKAAEAFTVPE